MSVTAFRISGRPATFATAGEKAWKEAILEQSPSPNGDLAVSGMRLDFRLPTLAPSNQPLDLDNLCEPMFSTLVNRIGWFGGKRPNLKFWYARKAAAQGPGCAVEILDGELQALPTFRNEFSGTYVGVLPRSAKAVEVANWANQTSGGISPFAESVHVGCFLGFGSSAVNIGDVATGPVKSVIDCLYPVLGGRPGAPNDSRIQELFVMKGFSDAGPNGVFIRLWIHVGDDSYRPLVRSGVVRTEMKPAAKGGAMPMNTQAEAVVEALRALGGEGSIREVDEWINRKYPGRWKTSATTLADLVHNGNPSSQYKEHERILKRVGRGLYGIR